MTIAKPTQVATPFANSGLKNSIPQSATGSNLASLEEGFPAVTMTAVGDGGEPPQGQDFNGILNQVTSQLRYAQAGGLYPYDSTFCAAIGGYPLGAILMSADGSKLWQNQVAGNANDPDSDDTNWTELCTVDALTAGLATKQGTLTFDTTPTANSSNPVTSDGILTALNTLSEAQLQALSSAISAIRGTAGSSAALSDYLPLAGGTMTGAIEFEQEENAGGVIGKIGNGIRIKSGAFGYREAGAYIDLNKLTGSFLIAANEGGENGSASLAGYPSGNLTWNGKKIESVNSSGTNWIRYESGIQIVWMPHSLTTAGVTITFPVAFSGTPIVTVSSNSAVVAFVTSLSSTGCKLNLASYDSNPRTVRVFAIGKWE